jgi:hypothetical protein
VEVLSSAFPNKQILVIGSQSDRFFQNVTFIKAGEIPSEVMEKYYADAEFVVFPSHYEGFGIPIVKSVAYNKVVYVRQSDLVDEILQHVDKPRLIKTYKSLNQLPDVIIGTNIIEDSNDYIDNANVVTWDMVASCVMDSINEKLKKPNNGYMLRRRLSALHAMNCVDNCGDIKNELENILKSRSWKITKPLRIAVKKLKSIKKYFANK